ncbi:MAG TPA: thioesterase family protein [Acidimicrobiales bacterium]|nr:thioesterase family protein [Acidimicrobiales bacterium]
MRLSFVPPTDPAAYPFTHTLRTRFAETDAMGVIHHAAYLLYLEDARVEFLRSIGHPYDEVRADGSDLAVLESFVRYRRALRFDEVVDVSLMVSELTGTTFQIGYLLTVDGATCATAVTVHGAVDPNGKASRLPDWVNGPRFASR